VKQFRSDITQSGLTIYDSLASAEQLFIPNKELEEILNEYLVGKCFDQPLRTRSKLVKTAVCVALGYPIPKSFKKVQPRFPGQDLDTYVQKSNNLQIWNEEISPSRRYALIRLDENDLVTRVRVVNGAHLANLDTTGTLTQKFQAKSRSPIVDSKLISACDTANVKKLIESTRSILPIETIFNRLSRLIGTKLRNPGNDQERNRGAELHRKVVEQLGMSQYSDSGQFPDVPEQLLEVKLQTSPTIDLGLVSPDGQGCIEAISGVRHSDVRYAIFYAYLEGDSVVIENIVLSTGEDFFKFFQRFEGKVVNSKIQIPLPSNFFS
jgi:hypothetical protein